MSKDIELVIKIPEEEYEFCKKQYDTECIDVLMIAVKEGIPLQKGHGDLIDRGKLKTHFIGTEQGTDLEVYLKSTVIGAEAIIKADNVESVGSDGVLQN
jgi:hypothetical protein